MNLRKMVVSALLMALGIILPFVTMEIPEIGNMLLPMHIPVLLCGFICGAPYAAVIGFILPLFRSFLLGSPPMMPIAMTMAIELMFYGLISGILYRKLKGLKFGIYFTLIPTMLLGRVAWGITAFVLYTAVGNTFTWLIFMTQAFVNAIPGIVIQLMLIPIIITSLKKMDMEVFFYGERKVSNNRSV